MYQYLVLKSVGGGGNVPLVVGASGSRQWSTVFDGLILSTGKGLSTREAGRGHATPHMPVEMAKCWWLLKI